MVLHDSFKAKFHEFDILTLSSQYILDILMHVRKNFEKLDFVKSGMI